MIKTFKKFNVKGAVTVTVKTSDAELALKILNLFIEGQTISGQMYFSQAEKLAEKFVGCGIESFQIESTDYIVKGKDD